MLKAEIIPQEVPRRSKPGILTQRRRPAPSGVQPYRPPPRHIHYKEGGARDYSWEHVVDVAHHRWEVQTGARVRAADTLARRANEGDSLDSMVQIQLDRQKRLASVAANRDRSIVQRLIAPPPPPEPPPLDALDHFARFVAERALMFAEAPKPKPPKPQVPNYNGRPIHAMGGPEVRPRSPTGCNAHTRTPPNVPQLGPCVPLSDARRACRRRTCNRARPHGRGCITCRGERSGLRVAVWGGAAAQWDSAHHVFVWRRPVWGW
eukprot:6265178-Prymnesium_polylepis.1